MAVTTSLAPAASRIAKPSASRKPTANAAASDRDQDHGEAEARARQPTQASRKSRAHSIIGPEGGGAPDDALWILIALALVGLPRRAAAAGRHERRLRAVLEGRGRLRRRRRPALRRRAGPATRARAVQVARARAVARARRLRRGDERGDLAPRPRRTRLDVARGRAGRPVLDRRRRARARSA